MGDSAPRHESADNQGSTVMESSTVGLVNKNFPAVAGPPISEFIIQCPDDQDIDNRLQVSMDGGTNFFTLQPSGNLAWTPKGQTVTQLTLLGNAASVQYEVIANLEVD